METADIRYCVEYIYNGPSCDFYTQTNKRFFNSLNDMCEFLVSIRDGTGDSKWCSSPVVFEVNFNELADYSVEGMVESYEKRKKINDSFAEQEKKVALSKLSVRELKILGLKER